MCKMSIDEDALICPHCNTTFDAEEISKKKNSKGAASCFFIICLGIGSMFSGEISGFWGYFSVIIAVIVAFMIMVSCLKKA